MTKPKLHLDNDASNKVMAQALTAKGHDVTRTPQRDLPVDATDEEELFWAIRNNRILFTYNIGDFSRLAQLYPNHRGIAFARQGRYTLSEMIALLDKMLSETTAEDWVGMVRWLSDWKK